MSGVLCVVDGHAGLIAQNDIDAMVSALRRRGDRVEMWRSGEVVLAVVRFEWELRDGYAGASLIVHDGDITVATDATLYYRADLRRRLRIAGVEPAGDTPGHLIASAYRVWGANCARFLEGDFAFVVYDHARGRVVAVRDFLGRRSLHHAEIGGGLIIASTVGAVIAHSRCARDFDPIALAETIAVSMSGETRTPYKHVKAVPAAAWLSRESDGSLKQGRHWHFPVERDAAEDSFDSAVVQLRELLGSAMLERLAPDTTTTIWLSGGYDSSALYGIGNDAMRTAGRGQLQPISVSYPEGDPGREDELIQNIVAFWQSSTTWVSIEDIPMLGAAAENAAVADIPLQHAFENWLRMLLAGSRRQQSRVAITGDGGDQLFAVSTVFLQDLFGALRWSELKREWRARTTAGVRGLWDYVARPVLGETARMIRGHQRPERGVPSWMREDFIQRSGLLEEQHRLEQALREHPNGRAWAETKGAIVHPIIHRVASAVSALGLEFGIEVRAPLMDRRVVEFALSRPRRERASGAAVKHLLRRAAGGLLPPDVLLPRPRKTGVLTGYFNKSLRADRDQLVTQAFSAPILAELGVVDAARMREAWKAYQAGRDVDGGTLFFAFQVEMWLRARTATRPLRSESASTRAENANGRVRAESA